MGKKDRCAEQNDATTASNAWRRMIAFMQPATHASLQCVEQLARYRLMSEQHTAHSSSYWD
jgi:hypothetical protein